MILSEDGSSMTEGGRTAPKEQVSMTEGEAQNSTSACVRTDHGTLAAVISSDHEGFSVGAYLVKVLGLTRKQVSRMKYLENGLRVNHVRVRVTYPLHSGDVLEVRIDSGEQRQAAKEKRVVPSEGALEILYEDDDLIALWKEAGLVVHPSHGHYSDTLSNRLAAYLQEKGETTGVRSIGRLDRDTSGILVFAKNQPAAANLWQQRENGIFRKEYEAVCEGRFDGYEIGKEYKIDAKIAPVPGQLMKMQVASDGKEAVTFFRILCQNAGEVCTGQNEKERCSEPNGKKRCSEANEKKMCSGKDKKRTEVHSGETGTIVRFHLLTGRTHQIRVHMAHLGHPLVGDALYGNGIPGKTFASLTAFHTEFRQPFTGEQIILERCSRKQSADCMM